MRYMLPLILYVGLTVYVIADIAQHRDEEPYRLPKTLWVLIVLFAPLIGAGAWIVTKLSNRGAPGTQGGGYRPPRAPDDDPSFRVWLNEQERRRRQDGGKD
ncbi:PLD nuclease N-terminal domain-containing protein [Demequina sp. TTPB684]|uniref:PLD nuclease N-terminal domain-containing protein n=1 Tax=unclassified Demequina TaxID=2620311 RepID=UPI001CF2302F|nr:MULTISPECIES: PLD nuclease N-terminal domain-containing protein [unclassified Demequina]MCB2411623.1 PLD nuclease N-terminal domain-containing protein [Demequina sp. TTPB684]UPU88282.1 PLD nuclease N-terminal domain-containing protein [Demequina sp. TMPB413]